VDDVKGGIGLGCFDPSYLALGANFKPQRFVSYNKTTKPKSAFWRLWLAF